jgi:hypothetical protein
MTGPANGSATGEALGLPAFSLDVQALDLGSDIKAVGLELLETESREPVRGKQAAEFWAATLSLLANGEPLVLDFFSHLERVREFCASHKIDFRETGSRSLMISQPSQEQLRQLSERFAAETFAMRSGERTKKEDAELADGLSGRGVDAYQAGYKRYSFCAICEIDDGWVTLLSDTLWPSEVVRRLRPAAQSFDVHIARPN